LREVSIELRPGEVHAVMGENGAGKSTLMKLLAGMLVPDSGRIEMDGREVVLRSPHAAARLGIAMIHQELMPFPGLTVAENILVGREPVWRGIGWVRRARLESEARRLLARVGSGVDPRRRMAGLTVAEMQSVEIARALAGELRVLIMDEPTSALSDREVEGLFRLIRELQTSGVAVAYITHRLEEVFRIADRVTVLRDGEVVVSATARGLSAERLIAWMVGREVGQVFPVLAPPQGAMALEVEGLGRAGVFRDVGFAVRAGQVVGLAGLMGAGRTEVLRAIYGLDRPDAGVVRVAGRPVRIRSPHDALQQGIAMVTEDRQRDGLVSTLTVRGNVTLSSLARCSRVGWVDRGKEASMVRAQVGRLGIKTPGLDALVGQLSGGNQQKVLLGRAWLTEPRVLLLDEPTRGIDVGAKLDVYALIAEWAQRGCGIVLVSSELPEVMGLCHRLLVMREGRVRVDLDPRQVTADEVMRWAMTD
jgi:ABC-type sugar transport system ATPase subunit